MLTRFCGAALFLLATGAMISGADSPPIPKHFSASIGGFLGSSYQVELHDDTLVLKSDGPGTDSSWPCPPPMSDGSHPPDWFDAVASEFLAEATGAAPRGANLAEARLCVALEQAARESSRQGGREISLTSAWA